MLLGLKMSSIQDVDNQQGVFFVCFFVKKNKVFDNRYNSVIVM